MMREVLRLGSRAGQCPGWSQGGEDVFVVNQIDCCRVVGTHRHRPRGGREMRRQITLHRIGFGHEGLVVEEGRTRLLRVGDGIIADAVGVGSRGVGMGVMPVARKIGGKVADERVETLCPEELDSKLPLIGGDKVRIGDDL